MGSGYDPFEKLSSNMWLVLDAPAHILSLPHRAPKSTWPGDHFATQVADGISSNLDTVTRQIDRDKFVPHPHPHCHLSLGGPSSKSK